MNRNQGGITVFLSLSLLLIMALLGTMVEVTRGKICRVHTRRTLKVAAERLMTEYNRPLYDRYGLFFLEDAGEDFTTCIAKDVAKIVSPEHATSHTMDLYGGTMEEVDVTNRQYVGDGGGEALLQQVEAHMKRQLTEDFIRSGINQYKPALSVEESAEEIEKKVEQEREEAQAGIYLLELMKWVDGVSCVSGGVRGETYFAKMFYRGENRAENLGITEAVVWNAIQDKMVNLDTTIASLMDVSVKNGFHVQVEKAKKKTKQALETMQQLGTQLETLSLGDDPIGVLKGNLRILEETDMRLDEEVTAATIRELDVLWKNYNTSGIVFSYTGVTETGGAENPMESFSETLSGGVLNLVLEENATLSDKKVQKADGYRQLYEESEEQEEYGQRVEDFAKDQNVKLQGTLGGITELSTSDYFLCEYVKKYFSSWESPKDDTCLTYELEYLLSGKRSDKENLEQMINRLFLVRTVVNTTTILATASYRETAYGAALSVVGFTGLEPLIRFTQTLFLVMWGMAEALVDVAGILQGRQVSFGKTKSEIKVTFPELFQVNRSYVLRQARQLPEAGENAFGYEEYLVLFLVGSKRSVSCYRMMDLMEANIRETEVEDFSLGLCVNSFEVSGAFTFPTKFFRFPYIQKIIERELYEFHADTAVTMAYVAD